ncbi:MAG: metal-sensing transcriptional repressor [Planctomycetia bacterium]|nr:metal-sensing transcriptional repressor [Planctomycetia bacterium]
MKKCLDTEKLHLRLNRIIGQLNAIQKMIDQDTPCEQVLVQINAAKGALHRVGLIVLKGHMNHCVREGIENGNAEATLEKFAEALEHFSRMS